MHLGILVECAKVDERAARHGGVRGRGGYAVWHGSVIPRRESIEHVADDEEQLATCRLHRVPRAVARLVRVRARARLRVRLRVMVRVRA